MRVRIPSGKLQCPPKRNGLLRPWSITLHAPPTQRLKGAPQVEDVLLVILGWFLGTLSPEISNAIARRKRRGSLKEILAAELNELRYTLAVVVIRLRTKTSTMSQATLDLSRNVIFSYAGDVDHQKVVEGMKKLLAQGDAFYIQLHNAKGAEESAIWPVPYDAPFLRAHLEDLPLFSLTVQQRLLRVIYQLGLFNEQIDFVRKAHDRTFDTSLSPENYAANQQNLLSGTEKLARRSETLIEAISQVVGVDGSFI